MRFRGSSIRRRVGALVLVPLISLALLWSYATAVTVSDARALMATTATHDALRQPTADLIDRLQRERRHTLTYLGDLRQTEVQSAMQRARRQTDRAVEELREAGGEAGGDLTDPADRTLTTLSRALSDDLPRLRDEVDSNTTHPLAALETYGAVLTGALDLLAGVQPTTDAELDRQGRTIDGMARVREHLAAQDALVASAYAAGGLTRGQSRQLQTLVLQRELVYAAHLPNLPLADQAAYQTFWNTGDGGQLVTAEQDLLAPRSEDALTPEQGDRWDQTSGQALAGLTALAAEAGDRHTDRVDAAYTAVLLRASLVAGGGFLVVLLSALVAYRVGRRHLRELSTLSKEARDAAEVRLPGVARRLAAGERIDVETEAPRLEYGTDDLGRVGQALNTLQRAAVSAAVERSATRRGVAEVFVNLARRSQVLLHRQLNVLESIERRADPAAAPGMADVVRLTHLTTRMRRHAEGLVVLSGAAPARQWGRPEHLMDLVRAAVDEVEDFERVELRRLPPLTVAGGAVPDLTHLIAELLENATVFSPPHTAVQVSGERVPHGVTLEIHDRGLGMTSDALQEANQRLSEPIDFELTDTDRLGLFVVARLAERHGVRVSLRDSPYGGTTAVTLIPAALLSEAKDADRALTEAQAPPELDGPVDGPVELEAPVSAAGPALTAGRPADADEHSAPRELDAPDGPSPLPSRRRQPMLVSDHGRPVAVPPAGGASGGADQGADRGVRPRPARPAGRTGTGTTSAGLPRRVRRTAQGPKPADQAPPAAAGPDDARPPADDSGAIPTAEVDADAVRTRMAALQRGWQRGRQQTDTRQAPTRRDHDSETDTRGVNR